MGNNLISGSHKMTSKESSDLTRERKRRCSKKKPKTSEVSYERDRLYVLEMQVDIERYQTCYVKCTKDRLIL
jgi:polyferredoxin